VNRVAANKHSGFIVDYIGLANHLTFALSIYSEEDAAGHQGTQGCLSELPILEERYRRLLQHFTAAGVRTSRHSSPGACLIPKPRWPSSTRPSGDEGHQTEGGFRGLLQEVPAEPEPDPAQPAGHPYRGAARRFGYLLRMVKERYKDDSLDISDAGEKVKALINEHLIDLGINPKIPPCRAAFRRLPACEEHSKGQRRSQGQRDGARHPQALHGALRRGPRFYTKLSEKLQKPTS
jgi:type I restriction enzyme, R subunit